MYKINTIPKRSNLILRVKGKGATPFLVTLFLLFAQLITVNSATASMVVSEQDHAPFEYERLAMHTLSDGEEIGSSYGTLFTGGTSTKDVWEDSMIDIHDTDFAHKPRTFSRDGDKKRVNMGAPNIADLLTVKVTDFILLRSPHNHHTSFTANFTYWGDRHEDELKNGFIEGVLYDTDDDYEHRFYNEDSHEHRFGESDYFEGVEDNFSSPVPLPSSLALFITSLLGLIGVWSSRFFITRSPERI